MQAQILSLREPQRMLQGKTSINQGYYTEHCWQYQHYAVLPSGLLPKKSYGRDHSNTL
jgi:hypothetical protein